VISRLFGSPIEIKPASIRSETFAFDRRLMRREEEIVVTETGHEVITRFPAETLMVAGAHYFTATGPLPTTREHEAAPSSRVREMVKAVTESAKIEAVTA
jgi:hypothetical protein